MHRNRLPAIVAALSLLLVATALLPVGLADDGQDQRESQEGGEEDKEEANRSGEEQASASNGTDPSLAGNRTDEISPSELDDQSAETQGSTPHAPPIIQALVVLSLLIGGAVVAWDR